MTEYIKQYMILFPNIKNKKNKNTVIVFILFIFFVNGFK